MSRFSGPQGPGAMSRHRAKLKVEAEARNALTPGHRRKRGKAPSVEGLNALAADVASAKAKTRRAGRKRGAK